MRERGLESRREPGLLGGKARKDTQRDGKRGGGKGVDCTHTVALYKTHNVSSAGSSSQFHPPNNWSGQRNAVRAFILCLFYLV